MGCGCLKASSGVEDPLRPGHSSKYAMDQSLVQATQVRDVPSLPGECKPDLSAVIQAAGRSAHVTDSKLDEVLDILAASSPDASSCWLREWSAKAPAKGRAGLVQLMQKVIGRALEANLTAAEELVAEEGGEGGDAAHGDFGNLTELCKSSLRLEPAQRNGVHAAMLVLSGAGGTAASNDAQTGASSVVPVLDRLVLLFRPSLLANIMVSAKNHCMWRDLEKHIGLPPLEKHLSLLSCGAKAVLLNLLLVPDGVAPAVVVVNRESALLDAGNQLPDRACVVSPYFESATGTKVVRGRHVEGGEGHGPRKEFFIATSSDALARWGNTFSPTPSSSSTAPVHVNFQGNRISLGSEAAAGDIAEADRLASQLLQKTLAAACVGDRLHLEFSDGVEVQRLVTATHGDSGVSVASQFDRSVCSGCVTVRHCCLQKALLPLFEFHRGSGQHWFSAYASELEHHNHGTSLRLRYNTFGKLLLLAVANRCKISFSLPMLFFRLLLHSDTVMVLSDLKGFDDDLLSSLKKCQKMNVSQFKSLKEVEDLPAEMTREDYVAEKVKETFTPQAMQEIRKGFWSLTEFSCFKDVSPYDLRQIICPTDNVGDDIDIRHIFKVVMEDEMAECKLFADTFWSVIGSFTLEEKKLFLRFVTGLEAPPEPGTERLLIELPFSAFSRDEHIAMLDMLPQAHTCSNTLELPNYHDALKESGRVVEDDNGNGEGTLESELRRLMDEKLRMAIRETASYELDAVPSAVQEAPAPVVRWSPEPEVPREDKRYSPGFKTPELGNYPASGMGAFKTPERGNLPGSGVEADRPDSASRPESVNAMRQATKSPDPSSPSKPLTDASVRGPSTPLTDANVRAFTANELLDGRQSRESSGRAESESLQSLRTDDALGCQVISPPPPPAASPPLDISPTRRVTGEPLPLQPLRPLRHMVDEPLEPLRPPASAGESFRTPLEPLRVPLRPPAPFMGEFGSPAQTGTEVDILEQNGDILSSLLHSRNGPEQQPYRSPEKMVANDLDHLIEELEMDLGQQM